jgi:response regulator RpfG family c-di-GMP phosphodiesterase
LTAGAIIARDHHEKWNGDGYPYGKKGEDIHIYGRIVAITDVFDALGSDRFHEKAWPLDRILEYLKAERGKHFEPRLVDSVLASLDKINDISNQFGD